MSPIIVVDRIEGEMVVIETPSGFFDIPATCFPWKVMEGDRFTLHKHDELENDLQKSKNRLNRLAARDKQSDIIDL